MYSDIIIGQILGQKDDFDRISDRGVHLLLWLGTNFMVRFPLINVIVEVCFLKVNLGYTRFDYAGESNILIVTWSSKKPTGCWLPNL